MFKSFAIPHLMKQLTVRTCSEGFYDRIRSQLPSSSLKLYQNAPSSSLDFTVQYVDTRPDLSDPSSSKTILALHGNPGTLAHFTQLILYFYQQLTPIRVIVPNSPDFSHTRATGNVYWHSTAEKAEFVTDLLAQLGIAQIDCLVSHSLGIQAAAALWEKESPIRVKSVALFSPQPLWTIPKIAALKNVLLIRRDGWYQFLNRLGIHSAPMLPMKFASIDEFLLCATQFLHPQDPDVLRSRLKYLVEETQIPVGVFNGELDVLVPRQSTQELYTTLGLSKDKIMSFDPKKLDGKKVIESSAAGRIRAYVVKGGGHFAYAKYAEASNQLLEQLLQQ